MEAEVQRARTAAEAGSRAKSMFLANMSHEFRTPLNAVLGFTQLLMRSSELSAHHQKHLKVIEHSGDHLLRLLDGLLEVSSIESGVCC
jgi:signal transduction histidine kinase